ncbi:MAG TPA: thioredoxin family protein [Candidatus Fermentibacter sp.]|nr:thioredoxin family protein [Candidatus Fermentibacter sp.]
MLIQILGTGCPKCAKLEEHVREAVVRAGLTDASVEKVKDLKEIMAFGVMMTPALAVDGEVLVTGRVPGVDELVEMIAGKRRITT